MTIFAERLFLALSVAVTVTLAFTRLCFLSARPTALRLFLESFSSSVVLTFAATDFEAPLRR